MIVSAPPEEERVVAGLLGAPGGPAGIMLAE
jgi:hypothetical protein